MPPPEKALTPGPLHSLFSHVPLAGMKTIRRFHTGKWIRWSGASATQTSVSQAISGRYSRIAARSRNVVTNTRPAVEPAKIAPL